MGRAPGARPRWGVFGGSFNPVHHGHLILATRAAETLGLERVLFVPAARSPLKEGQDLAPGADRLRMLRLAIRGEPRFKAVDVELRREGPSYTIDTLRELTRRYPVRFSLILGADAAALLDRWKSVEEIGRLVRLAILRRPGHSLGENLPIHDIVEAPLLEISSSEIRDRRRRGRSIRYLVPDAVERYIRARGLYRR